MKRFEVPVYFDVDAADVNHAWELIANYMQEHAQRNEGDAWHSWIVEEPIEYSAEDM